MRSLTIGENDAGQRLDRFVQKAVPRLPQSMLYKAIRTKRIKLNHKRCEISTRLTVGDVIELYLNDEFFGDEQRRFPFLAAPADVDVLYEDANILLADKKPGLLVHEDAREQTDTLIHRIQRYLYDRGEYRPEDENVFAPALCNRIDRNTGGIVIAAKNAVALREMSRIIKERELKKLYLCIVQGRPDPPCATLEGYLAKDSSNNTVRVYPAPRPGAKRILTKYTVLHSDGQHSLLEVDLLTGRTHQIRAHMAYIGHPLLGDGKYGVNRADRAMGYRYQALCSYKLQFLIRDPQSPLYYLNGRTFEVKDVWFRDRFLQGEL